MNFNIYRYLRDSFILAITLILCFDIIPSAFAQKSNLKTYAAKLSPNSVQLFFPLISKNTDTDLTVGFVEITQAVQNSANSVTLVANRQTVIRIYPQANLKATPNVYVSISAYRGGSQISGSPLVIGPGMAPLTWSRADINSSFNAYLPSAWLSGNVTLITTVDPYNTIEEINNANNSTSNSLNFTPVPPLEITIVPIRYRHTDGKIYGPASSSYIQSAFLRIYPVNLVNVFVHNPYNFYDGDLEEASSWIELLDRITNIKTSEGAPDSTVYFGLIPLLDTSGNTWWNGGYAGLGWLSNPPNQIWREAIGLTDAYLKQYNYNLNGNDIVTHEVGHNFGRRHAPCGNPDSVDPLYPYPGGKIGQYGFDPITFQAIPPTSYFDIMGYCDSNWISDYTYLGLLQNQAAYGAPEALQESVDSLYIRAKIGNDGAVELMPFYAFPNQSEILPKESEYYLELVDASGEIIAAYPIEVRVAESKNFQAKSIHTMIPTPSSPFTEMLLKRNGEVVSRRSNIQLEISKTSEPSIYLADGKIVLEWGVDEKPALVRYKIEDSKMWTTLGIDILGGQILLDPLSLPKGKLIFEIILADSTTPIITIPLENNP